MVLKIITCAIRNHNNTIITPQKHAIAYPSLDLHVARKKYYYTSTSYSSLNFRLLTLKEYQRARHLNDNTAPPHQTDHLRYEQ